MDFQRLSVSMSSGRALLIPGAVLMTPMQVVTDT